MNHSTGSGKSLNQKRTLKTTWPAGEFHIFVMRKFSKRSPLMETTIGTIECKEPFHEISALPGGRPAEEILNKTECAQKSNLTCLNNMIVKHSNNDDTPEGK